MKKLLQTFVLFFFTCTLSIAQDFAKQTEEFREKYKEEFVKTPNSPLKKEDLKFLRFFNPDSSFRVNATFSRVKNTQSFEMPTYSGKNKTFVEYGKAKFRLYGRRMTLTIYRSLSLQTLPQYRDYLFLPFKDRTSGSDTYGGGRYIDLKTSDVKDGSFVLDFNKAYNPYCAYSDGYNCPIPPKANHLVIAIDAGEKNFGKTHD